ncbi:MAG: DUF4010 domain-containing protein, partial [Candidatus Hydrothermarchaeaceae archaeon]
PQILMAASGLIYARFIKFEKGTKKVETPIEESPFAIIPSIRFAVFFMFISFLVAYLKGFGAESVYIAAFLGGLVTSAGVTASLASLAATGSLDPVIAAHGCVISAMGSSVGKVVITRISGTAELTKEVVVPQVIVVLVGLFALLGMGAL